MSNPDLRPSSRGSSPPPRIGRLQSEDSSAGGTPGAQQTLADWLRFLRDGWLALAIAIVVATSGGVLATLRQSTEYRATGSLVVTPRNGFLDPNGADALPALTDTVVRLAETPAVLAGARVRYVRSENFAASSTRRQIPTIAWLQARLSATQVANSSIIEISATAPTQRVATDVIRATLSSLEAFVNRPQTRGAPTAGIVVRVVSQAEPDGRVSPTPTRNVLIGANVGALLGIVFALIVGSRRRRLRRPAEIAAELGIPLIGTVSRDGSAGMAEVRARLIHDVRARAEQLTLIVTGTVPPDKIAKFSRSLVESIHDAGLRPVLVDADLSTQASSRLLSVSDRPGLAEVLESGDSRALALRFAAAVATPSEIDILPAGQSSAEATALLNTDRLLQIIGSLRERYDAVVVAGPDLDRRAEAIPVLAAADSALLLVNSGIFAERLRDARRLGADLEQRFAGVVVIDGR